VGLGSGVRGWQSSPGGTLPTLEAIEDLLAASFTSPLGSLNVAYNDPANAFEFDINEGFAFTWDAQHDFLGDGGSSTSTGGSINVTTTGHTGAGLVLYSNRGADAAGRLLVVRVDNALNPQQAVRIENDGLAHAVSISHAPNGGAGDATAEALDIVSTNPLDTALGISGNEEGRGTIKVTHNKPANPDTNASVLSMRANGVGTAAQGIFFDAEDVGGTTGKLLNFRQEGVEKFVVAADGGIAAPSIIGRAATNLEVVGGTAVADVLTLRPSSNAGATGGVVVDLSVSQTQQITLKGALSWTATASAILRMAEPVEVGAGGALKVLQADPAITYTASPANAGLQVFSFFPTITAPISPIDMRGVRVFRDTAQVSLVNATAHGSIGGLTEARAWATLEARRTLVAGTGGATATFGILETIQAADTVGTGWTVTTYRLAHLQSPLGAGTITNLIALDLDDYGGRATTPLSIRSLGALVEMRHVGPIVVAANAAASGVSVGLEVQSTTKAMLVSRMTTAQKNALTALKGMIVYDTTTDTFEGFQGAGAGGWAAL
jgi:hypothetical protein